MNMDAALVEARDVLEAAVRQKQANTQSDNIFVNSSATAAAAQTNGDVSDDLSKHFFPGDSTQNLFVPSRWNPDSMLYRHILARPFSVDAADGDQQPTTGVRLLAVTYTAEASTITSRHVAATAPPKREHVTNDSFGLEVPVPMPNLKKELLQNAPHRIAPKQHVRSVSPDVRPTHRSGDRHEQGSPDTPRDVGSRPSPGRKSLLQPGELGLSSRFVGHRCNASNITTTALLLGVTKAVITPREAVLNSSALSAVAPKQKITFINLSYTKLGLQGPRRPPLRYNEMGAEVDVPPPAKTIADLGSFWADEPATGIDGIAKRSLALALIMPLLYVPRPELFEIDTLIADSCDLTDADAIGLAALLRLAGETAANDDHVHCVLSSLSLRNNKITNVGADALKKAVKYCKTIYEIRLEGNSDISDFDILRTMEDRLAENRCRRPAVAVDQHHNEERNVDTSRQANIENWRREQLQASSSSPSASSPPQSAIRGESARGGAHNTSQNSPQPAAAAVSSPSPGRKTLLKPGEQGLASRFLGHHCNASNITTVALLVGVSKVIVSAKATGTSASLKNGLITTINLSNTRLGLQGRRRPPVRFDEHNKEVNPPPPARTPVELGDYWVDESSVGIDGIAKRSLALALIMPMLHIPRPAQYLIKDLIADNCDLTDADCIGLAAVMRMTYDSRICCALERLSLRNNKITNVGANALKKAVKYCKTICEIRLEGNSDISDFDILRTMEDRLAENRKNAET